MRFAPHRFAFEPRDLRRQRAHRCLARAERRAGFGAVELDQRHARLHRLTHPNQDRPDDAALEVGHHLQLRSRDDASVCAHGAVQHRQPSPDQRHREQADDHPQQQIGRRPGSNAVRDILEPPAMQIDHGTAVGRGVGRRGGAGECGHDHIMRPLRESFGAAPRRADRPRRSGHDRTGRCGRPAVAKAGDA